MVLGLDLESKRRCLHVENRKGAFLHEKGVAVAQGLRLHSWLTLEKHNSNSSAGSQVIRCTGSGHIFGHFQCSQRSSKSPKGRTDLSFDRDYLDQGDGLGWALGISKRRDYLFYTPAFCIMSII